MNIKHIAVLLLALATGMSSFAQTVEQAPKDSNKMVQNRIGVYADFGYSMLPLAKTDFTKNAGSWGAGIGLLYELNKNHFLFDVQAGFQLYNSTLKINDFSCLTHGVSISDGQGTGDLKYNFKNYREQQLMGQGELALLFGAEFNKFYFLVGPKVGAALMGSYKVKTDASTSFQDQAMLDEFQDMANHSFKSYTNLQPTVDDKKLHFKTPNVMASLEIGYNVFMKDQSRLRLAAFCDYGLLNIHDYKGNQVADNATHNYPLVAVKGAPSNENIQSFTALGNGQIGDVKQNSFLVGLKLTYTYQFKKKEPVPPTMVTPTLLTYVTDQKTGTPLDTATVTYRSVETGKLCGTRRTARKTGIASTHLTRPGDYLVVASRNGYQPDTMTVKIEEHALLPKQTPEEDTTKVRIHMALNPVPVYSSQVFDIESGNALRATAVLVDLTTGQTVATAQLDSLKSKMTVENLNPAHQYIMQISAPGYMNATEPVEDISGMQTIYLSPVRKGAKIVLNNLYFEYAKTNLLDESKPELDNLEQFFYNNKEVHVRFVGHTDNIGTDASNQALSEGRAKAVMEAMIARGVDASRMTYEGKGESQPVDTNDTEAGRQHNRRVELVVE